MTRRASDPAKPTPDAPGGSYRSPKPIDGATRRAEPGPKPGHHSPGGSKVDAKPDRNPTRRATVVAKPDRVPPGGSTQGAIPNEAPTQPGGTLRDLIREVDTDRSVEEMELARAVSETLSGSGRLHLLLPILADEIRRVRRAHVLRVERATFRKAGEPAEGGWLRLLPEGFANPRTGRWVTWGQATVEDHEARIGWLTGQMEALGQDVDRHQQAIKIIREHGVTCLAEVEAAA